jgi:hypothetical protein
MKPSSSIKQETPSLSKAAVTANLDTSHSMQSFLKADAKVILELSKGVAALKHFVYPSVLQKEAIPVLRQKKKNANVIIRYSAMSGIKLTVLLPTVNQLLREIVANPLA